MGHLAAVCNLLGAVGEAPLLGRSQFPLEKDRFPLLDPISLRPFGHDTLCDLVRFEQPACVGKTSVFGLIKLMGVDGVRRAPYDTLGGLYQLIKRLIHAIPEDELFVGAPSAQVVTAFPTHPSPVRAAAPTPVPFYDIHLGPITDRASAGREIDRVVEEGEGKDGTCDRPDGHFGRLMRVAEEYCDETRRASSFQPARPVVCNPAGAGSIREGQTAIANRATLRVCELFDEAYATTVALLLAQFGLADAPTEQFRAVERVAYFPLMTQVIRPLGDLLTELPAREGDASTTAGPSFSLGRPPRLQPDRTVTWRLAHRRLHAMAQTTGALSGSFEYPVRVRTRLAFVHENLARIAADFAAALSVPPLPAGQP